MTHREPPAPPPVEVLRAEVAALRSELEACRAEQRWERTLLDNSPDIITRFGRDFRHLYVNAAVESATGRRPADFIGKTNSELGMPAEQVSLWEQCLDDVFATGAVRTVEFPFTAPTGETRHYEWRLVPEYGPGGGVESVLTVAREVTRRKAAEAALQQRSDDLNERVKELHCLYAVAELSRRSELDLPTLFTRVLAELTAAYRYPGIACARIRVDGLELHTQSFTETRWRQAAPIRGGSAGGILELYYREQPPDTARTFLDEEHHLLDAVAGQLGRALAERAITAARAASERRYRELFENMPDAYALHEILLDERGVAYDYRFLEVNAAFERMLGLSREDVVGHSVLHRLPATERHWIETYAKVALTGEALHVENYSREFDRYFQVSAFSPQRGLFATIFTDVTERHRLRESIEKGNELLNRVFESIHVMLAYMDRDFNFLLVNRAYAAADGREPGDFPGHNHFEFYPNEENETLFRRVVTTGEPYVVYGKPFSYAENPDRPVSYWDWRLEPVQGRNGSTEGLILSLLNVTERMRIEKEAREVGHWNQLLLNSVGEGIYGIDLEGNCTFANPATARMLGYTVKELVGRPAHETFHHSREDGSPYPVTTCPVHRSFRSGSGSTGADQVYWRRDGSSFPIEFISTPLVEDGNVIGAVTSFMDITERKRSEAELRSAYSRLNNTLKQLQETQLQVIQSEKLSALGTLAAGVAHELNNPLMGVMGYVAQARFATGNETVQRVLARAERELERMRTLLKNMLGFAHPIEEASSLIDLAEVVDRSLTLMQSEFKVRGIEVDTAFPDRLPPVLAKEGHLQQVFVNLLMNARDALTGQPNKRIRLTAERRGRQVAVQVADSGPGVAADLRERIFDPFFTTKPPGQGTGLGLSISRNIVADLGGTLSCECHADGGATFTLTLPVGPSAGDVGEPD